MATINNLYVWVENEEITNTTESTAHPVEKGLPITDCVVRRPVELSISGKIVKSGNMKATDIVKKLKELQNSGSLITYVGRNTLSNMQIQSFPETYVNTNWGGCDFSMTLKEVRIAQTAFVPIKKKKTNNAGAKQVQKSSKTDIYHIVKKGDTCWGYVTRKYKTLDRGGGSIMTQCNWILNKNPHAFSRKGDFRTMQIGRKVLVGYRK